jgi:hypothetical protein
LGHARIGAFFSFSSAGTAISNPAHPRCLTPPPPWATATPTPRNCGRC